jgi:hypothetical protein
MRNRSDIIGGLNGAVKSNIAVSVSQSDGNNRTPGFAGAGALFGLIFSGAEWNGPPAILD